MKQLSHSILVLAGAIMIAGGANARNVDHQVFAEFVGCVVGLIGLVNWWKSR